MSADAIAALLLGAVPVMIVAGLLAATIGDVACDLIRTLRETRNQ